MPTLMFLYLNVEGEMWLKFASRANLKGAVGLEGFKVAIWQLTGEGSGGSILPAFVFLHYSMMKHGFLTPVLSVSFSLTCMLLVCVDSPNMNDPGGSYINRYPKGKLWFPNKYKFRKALLARHCCKVTMSPNSLQIGGSLHSVCERGDWVFLSFFLVFFMLNCLRITVRVMLLEA